MRLRFTPMRGGGLQSCAVVLTCARDGEEPVTVRVFDFAHGVNEMHRCEPDGEKLDPEPFHPGSAQEGWRRPSA
jgi:hypothetical protein